MGGCAMKTILNYVILLVVVVCLVLSGNVHAKEHDIEELIAALSAPNFGVSSQATDALVELGNQAVPALEELLAKSNDQVVRLKALVTLRRIGTVETIGPLSLGLLDSSEVNRKFAEEALAELSNFGVASYQQMLIASNSKLSTSAIDLLLNAGWSYQDIIQYLFDQFYTSSENTQKNIMRVFGELGSNGAAAVPELLDLISDDNLSTIVRLAGLDVLKKIDVAAISLQNWTIGLTSTCIGNYRRLYWTAFDALVEGGKNSVPLLVNLLESQDPELRNRAAIILGEIGPQADSAIPALQKAISDPEWYIRAEAANALGRIDSKNFDSQLMDSIALTPPARADQDVLLADLGNEVKINNGLISINIGKKNARVTRLVVNGQNLVSSKGGYFDANAPDYFNINADKFEVVQSDPDMVHVKGIKYSNSAATPFEIESHYILRRGDSGYYAFLVYRHNSNFRAELVQTRQVIRVDINLMPNMIVSNNRQGQLPTPHMLSSAENVMDATDRLADGSVYTKYNWAMYEGEHYVHGFAGNNIGLWVIKGSNEYQPSGPIKQNLTVHSENVVLAMLHSTHYGSKAVWLAPNSGWEKIYGPFFVYVNTGTNLAELWTDAKVRAEHERQSWPYDWLDIQGYDTARGHVSGRLTLTDGSIPEGAWVILGEPTTRWEAQAKDYLYWSTVETDGSFTIANVRPGQYKLWAWGAGVLGELEYPGISVTANSITTLEPIIWEPLSYGTLIWEIGIPDRSAAEFLAADHYRNWGLWFEYPTYFPKGVNYYPGISDYTEDWNYVQPAVVPGKYGNQQADPWRIYFRLPDQPTKETAVLTIAIAGTGGINLDVLVNGQKIATRYYSADGSVHRSGVSGIYHLEQLEFDSNLVQPGENIVELQAYGTNSLSSGIIYDYLRLEI